MQFNVRDRMEAESIGKKMERRLKDDLDTRFSERSMLCPLRQLEVETDEFCYQYDYFPRNDYQKGVTTAPDLVGRVDRRGAVIANL